MDESEIVETWLESTGEEWYGITEVPVGPRKSEKFSDIVLVEEYPFSSEEEMAKIARDEVIGLDYDKQKNEFRATRGQMRLIAEQAEPPLSVRVYEAKQRLNAKSLGQILVYREHFTSTYGDVAEIDLRECGIIFGEDDPTVRQTARSFGISLHFVCPECGWTGQVEQMDKAGRTLKCPNCSESSNDVVDLDRVVSLKEQFDSDYYINGKCIRFRAAALKYFDTEPAPDDVVGYMTGATMQNLAAAIAIVRGEDVTDVRRYAGQYSTKLELVTELQQAIEELGFDVHSSDPTEDIGAQSIGPIIPWILAVLTEVHEIDVEEAVSQHGARINMANEQDPNAKPYSWD